jgi:8-oxo-dGTP pyrophosphatase MutT (NUDIX family)
LWEEIGIVSIAAAPPATLHIPESAACPREPWVYLVTAWRGEPQNLLPDEHDALAWFTVDETTTLALATPLYLALFRRVGSMAGL